MMKSQGNGNGKDHVQGKVYRGKKWDPKTQTFVDGKFFNLALYLIGEDQEPIITGTRTIERKGKAPMTVPKYTLAKVFRIAESSLLKVAAGESKSCNIYFSERK